LADQINTYAADHNVRVVVTQSLRTNRSYVPGAIVPPARRSNHLVGHAFDFNIAYGPNYSLFCNSTCLSSNNVPPDVQAFINDLRNDSDLRYGGDFTPRDVVHVDDGLNV